MNLYPLTVVDRCARKAASVDYSWSEEKKRKEKIILGDFTDPRDVARL